MTRQIPKIDTLDDEAVAKFRSMTPGEKIQMASDLNRAARIRAAERLRNSCPNWSEEQLQAEIAKRMLAGDYDFFG